MSMDKSLSRPKPPEAGAEGPPLQGFGHRQQSGAEVGGRSDFQPRLFVDKLARRRHPWLRIPLALRKAMKSLKILCPLRISAASPLLQAFRERFVAWVGALTKAPLDVIAIDGKTSRRSGRKGAKETVHMVSAFAARQRLVLAQTKVNEKSNEIVAIPALLDMLSIEGAIVTIDAMGCQRSIAQKIIDKKADYVLALKGNQGTLRDDVELFATEQKSRNFADAPISVDQTVDADHGRIETRRVTVVHDVAWLQQRHQWPGLKGVVIVESKREIGPKTERETRYYVTSSTLHADKLGRVVRDHWAIENGLHWVMDMTFRDDECRIRTDNAPENIVTLKHLAANLARRKKGKDSVRLALKTAAWDDDYLANLIAA
jgi:predicted transposase YbfD/YdcC